MRTLKIKDNNNNEYNFDIDEDKYEDAFKKFLSNKSCVGVVCDHCPFYVDEDNEDNDFNHFCNVVVGNTQWENINSVEAIKEEEYKCCNNCTKPFNCVVHKSVNPEMFHCCNYNYKKKEQECGEKMSKLTIQKIKDEMEKNNEVILIDYCIERPVLFVTSTNRVLTDPDHLWTEHDIENWKIKNKEPKKITFYQHYYKATEELGWRYYTSEVTGMEWETWKHMQNDDEKDCWELLETDIVKEILEI